MKYKEKEYKRVKDLLAGSSLFNRDPGKGSFRGKVYDFVLQEPENNLYNDAKNDMVKYFKDHAIAWWNGALTGHPLSSQVTCLNHLFPIRQDKATVIRLIQNICPEIQDVLETSREHSGPAYIEFEYVSSRDHLNEKYSTRGRNCTSLDAVICGVHEDGRRILFPIEWKHAETYGNTSKSDEKRRGRYDTLISQSAQLVPSAQDVFYYEPFYQLMRQTLWAEQMIKHAQEEEIKAEDFIHIHVIPEENKELLDKRYLPKGSALENTWRSCLQDQAKYVLISPDKLVKNALLPHHNKLMDYLTCRYWY